MHQKCFLPYLDFDSHVGIFEIKNSFTTMKPLQKHMAAILLVEEVTYEVPKIFF
jgi:hypothetical protein